MVPDRKLRKVIRQWRRRYPYPLWWMDSAANKQCRRSEQDWLSQFEGATVLRRRDVTALVAWRSDVGTEGHWRALAGIDGPGPMGNARRCIKKAAASSSPTQALDHLLGDGGGIPGWDVEMASTVHAVCRAELYVVAGERALHAMAASSCTGRRRQGRSIDSIGAPISASVGG